MADAKGIRAGRAFVEIFADDSKLVRGLNSAQKKLATFGAGVRSAGLKMMAVGGSITGPLILAAKNAADSGAELYDMSRRTGMAVESLSMLGYAADQSGTSLETVEGAVRRMQKSIAGVADETEGTTGKLDELGISADQIAGKRPEEQFAVIAAAISAIQDPSERAAAAMKVFGRSGTALLPMIEDFDRLSGEAKKFGLVKSTGAAKGAKEFTEAMTLARTVTTSAWNAIGSAVMPILKQKAQRITQIVAMVRDWLKQNSGLVVSIFQIATAVTIAGAAIVGIGYVITGLSKVFGVLSTMASIIGTALSAVVTVIGAMLSPIGLVITAVVGLGAYFLYASGAAGKAMGWLGGVIDGVVSDAQTAFGAIGKALAAGDIALAAKVLWLTLKMWWEQGTSWISEIWNGALLWIKQRFFEVWGGLRIIFSAVGHGLCVAWIETTAFLSSTWTRFVTAIQEAWNWCATGLQKAWNKIKGVFDSSFDANGANAAAEQAYQAKVKDLESNKDAALAERERKRQAQRDAEGKDFDEQLGRIIDETEAAKQAAQDERNAKLKANQSAVDAARKEWQGAISEAQQAKPKAGPAGAPDMADYMKNAQFALDDLTAKSKDSARGTFNAAALQGLAAGGPADKIVKNTEATAQNTAKLLEKDFGGSAFA